MNDNKSEVVARLNIMRTVLDLFPHGEKPSTDAGVQKYIQLTMDIPLPEFERCMDEAAASSRFFPTVADVRGIYNKTRPDNPALGLPTKEEAWGSVQRAIAGVGFYGTPSFRHPLVEKAVHNMGWRDLCLSENQDVMRSNFFRVWDELVRRETEIRSYLPGTQKQLATNGIHGLIAQTVKQLAVNGNDDNG
jgi:hypothetical protein